MNIEDLEQIKQDLKAVYNVMYNFDDMLCDDMQVRVKRIETLLTAYEKEKEKNKKAIDFINQRKKIVNKDMAEGTRLQVGTFMWQVDELLEILKGVEEE